MRTGRHRFLSLFVILLLLPAAGFAQTDLEDALKQLSGPNTQAYMQPGADLFAANMHSGYFHSARIARMGFTFEFALIAMTAPITDEHKTCTMSTPAGFVPATFETATIFGGKGTTIQNSSIPGLSYKGPDGIFNTSMFPLAAPQVTIGSVIGTQVSVRYIPIPKVGNQEAIPEGKTWAVGVRHSISQWFGILPLDVAASYFYNSMDAGDLLKFTGSQFGLEASKNFSVLVVYGGLAYENATMKVSYTYEDPYTLAKTPVTVELDGANTVRATLGLGVELGILKIFANANFGSVIQYSGGIALGN
jgi:Family of unknown function (DUF6588)